MNRLVDGHVRFKRDVFPERKDAFLRLARAQSPQAMVVTCADSRIVPEMLLQADPGDLFVYRNAGNLVPPYSGAASDGASAAIEYAVVALGVEHIIILGHSDCGAMKATLSCEDPEGMPTVRAWLRHADVARDVVARRDGQLAAHDKLDALVHQNVISQLYHLRTHPSVAARLATGQLGLHGWVYHIADGAIVAVDDSGQFRPLEDCERTREADTTAPRCTAHLVEMR